MAAPDALRVEIVSVLAVMLIATVSSLLLYHFYLFYKIKHDVFKGVEVSLNRLWEFKISDRVDAWLIPDVAAGVRVVDSYNNNVQPIVQSTFDVFVQKETAASSGARVIVAEVLIVGGLCAGLVYLTYNLRRILGTR